MKKITKNCPKCGEIIDEQDLICPNCNELVIEESTNNQEYTCPVCGAQNEEGSKSCAFCCSIISQ
ncbi:MAG: zinc ribbon domain-containing protein [Bacteroidota bacterium]